MEASMDIELVSYYERLLETLKSDVDAMLQEPEQEKRSPKIILSYLKMASECEEIIGGMNGADTDEAWWDELSASAKDKIIQIIEEDRGITAQ